MNLYLIRHAESIANTQGVYQGQTYDTGLSPLGKKQAAALKERLKDEQIDALYSSPSLRCVETARPLSKYQGLEIITNKNLLEISHGDWEGKTRKEIEKLFPGQLRIWKEKPNEIQMPNGENIHEVKKRVESFLEGLRKIYEQKNVLACAHDAILRIILAPILNLDYDKIWGIQLDSAAITRVAWSSPKTVISLNDSKHLKDLLADTSKHAL